MVLDVVDGLVAVAMKVVKWAMFLTPYAVFGLRAQLIARVGISTLLGMATYVLSVVAGLVGLLALYLALVSTLGRRNPFRFLANVAAGFGIPATALPLVLGVDRILDVCRTAVNLTGDLVATVLLAPRPSSEAPESIPPA